MLSPFDIVPKLCTSHLIDEIDESLSLFSPKIPCGSDPGWGVHKRPDVRNGLGRGHTFHLKAVEEDGRWRRGAGLVWAEACLRRVFGYFHRSSFETGRDAEGSATFLK